MGGLNVKNTIVERVLEIVAPHPCLGCGKVGTLLCQYCKYDIMHEPFVGCLFCASPCSRGVCERHSSSIGRTFVVTTREGVMRILIDAMKFQRVKGAIKCLAEVLDASLPLLPSETRVIPIPTLASHVRQRGYGQVEGIARHLASKRGLSYVQAIQRQSQSVQRTASKAQRLIQSEQAFMVKNPGEFKGALCLLVDDIVTTGATVQAAATLLRAAGATVWIAALAYHPLD